MTISHERTRGVHRALRKPLDSVLRQPGATKTGSTKAVTICQSVTQSIRDRLAHPEGLEVLAGAVWVTGLVTAMVWGLALVPVARLRRQSVCLS